MHLSLRLSLYEVSSVVLLSSCMYWLCMAEGIAKSRLQIPVAKPLTLTPGHNVQNVVSFELVPHFNTQTGALQAICVTHPMNAQQIVTNPNTIS
jgi:hypothetical protein